MKINWISNEKIVDTTIIKKTEAFFDIEFPETYKKLVQGYNGGSPEKSKVFLTDEDDEREFGVLLNYNTNKSQNIIDIYNNNRKFFPPKVFPFACDPAGNYICFDYRNNMEPEIVFWDHELDLGTKLIESNENQITEELIYKEGQKAHEYHNISFISLNFDSFLEALYEPDFGDEEEDIDQDFWDKLIKKVEEKEKKENK